MAAKKETDIIPKDKLVLYANLVETNPAIERKGVAMPYTSHNGHMFSFLSPNGTLALRLSEKDRENFLKKYKASLMEAHGVIMKEYVTIPGKLLKNTKELKVWLDASYNYIKSLKPKPSKENK